MFTSSKKRFRFAWSRAESAECFGTFLLTFAVATALLVELAVPVPFVAALTLALLVYTIGPVSGAHVNPAVTLGLLSIGKVTTATAVRYVIAQAIGAALAMAAIWLLSGEQLALPMAASPSVALGEGIGAFILTFGITAVVYGHVHEAMTGIVVGWSLLLGILIASASGNGVVNPAVAFGIGSFNVMYLIGPLVGGVLGAQFSAKLVAKKK